MKWMLPLFVGEKAQKNKDNIIKGIRSGTIFLHTYVILLSRTDGNQLDIVQATELRQPYYRKGDHTIIGIAVSKKEAIDVVAHIAEKAIAETGDANTIAYLIKKLRESKIAETEVGGDADA